MYVFSVNLITVLSEFFWLLQQCEHPNDSYGNYDSDDEEEEYDDEELEAEFLTVELAECNSTEPFQLFRKYSQTYYLKHTHFFQVYQQTQVYD